MKARFTCTHSARKAWSLRSFIFICEQTCSPHTHTNAKAHELLTTLKDKQTQKKHALTQTRATSYSCILFACIQTLTQETALTHWHAHS